MVSAYGLRLSDCGMPAACCTRRAGGQISSMSIERLVQRRLRVALSYLLPLKAMNFEDTAVGPLDNRHTDEIAALLAVAAEGSFVAAGRLLQRHPSVVSKRLAAMEKRLGVRLIERSTRHVRMTDAGRALVDRLRSAIGSITEAEQEASSGAAEIRGVLRVALPAAMGRLWIGPMLPEFLRAHPHVTLIADYSERFVDII